MYLPKEEEHNENKLFCSIIITENVYEFICIYQNASVKELTVVRRQLNQEYRIQISGIVIKEFYDRENGVFYALIFFLRQKQEPSLNWVREVRVAMFNKVGGYLILSGSDFSGSSETFLTSMSFLLKDEVHQLLYILKEINF